MNCLIAGSVQPYMMDKTPNASHIPGRVQSQAGTEFERVIAVKVSTKGPPAVLPVMRIGKSIQTQIAP